MQMPRKADAKGREQVIMFQRKGSGDAATIRFGKVR
jgi:hypothetical protein